MSETKHFPSFSRPKTASEQTMFPQTAHTSQKLDISRMRNDAAIQKMRHPFFALCVCFPFLLPDFYLWQTYYEASGKGI